MSAPKSAPIPGLSLIDPLHLPQEFRKFKNDELYFIATCRFHCNPPILKTAADTLAKDVLESLKGAKTSFDVKPVPRCLAVTPAAIFVCDPNGKMDRATRLEMLDGMFWEIQVVKKFFGSEEAAHLVIKIPKEPDIHVSFEKDATQTSKEGQYRALYDLFRIVDTMYQHRNGGRRFNVTEHPSSADLRALREVMNEEPPEGFLTPQEIIAANAARQLVIQRMEGIAKESVSYQTQIQQIEQTVRGKQQELATLEKVASGGDLVLLRQQRDRLQAQMQQVSKAHNELELELVKYHADIDVLKAQLAEEKQQTETELAKLQEEVAKADGGKDPKAAEMDALKKKNQQRELEKAAEQVKQLKSQYRTPSYPAGATGTTLTQLEAKVQQACDKLERDIESNVTIDRFTDKCIVELRESGDKVMELFETKRKLVAQRKAAKERAAAAASPPPPAAPPAAASASPAPQPSFDDDDLLGGGPAKPAAAPVATGPGGFDDDDLLGGGPVAKPPPPAPQAGFDDDDLLGGGPTPASAPPAATPVAVAEDAGGDLI